MKKLKRYISVILLSLFVTQTFGDDNFNADFQQGLSIGSSKSGQVSQNIQNLHPEQMYKQYTTNPDQTKYYQGETQTNTNMSKDAAQSFLNTDIGQSVYNSFNERPDFKIDPNAPEMKQSKIISNDAADIVNGVSDQYVDCSKTQQCHTEYTTQSCNEQTDRGQQSCSKQLIAQAIPEHYDVNDITINLVGNGATGWFGSAGFDAVIDLKTGKIVSTNGRITQFNASGTFTAPSCDGLSFSVINTNPISPYTQTQFSVTQMPSCGNHFLIAVHLFGGRHWFFFGQLAGEQFTVRIQKQIPMQITESWNDNCIGLEQQASVGTCALQSEKCTVGPTTKMINGVPVTAQCWEKQDAYDCGQGAHSDNNCQPLRDKGCQQIGSKCQTMIGNVCVVSQEDYQCPVQKCTGGIGMVCGGDTFCLQGNCSQHNKTPDQNFNKGVSALSAGASATTNFDGAFIFKGNDEECREDGLDFANCCADSGWGKDIHLAQCNPDEQKLGVDKQNGLTVYVGDYCSKKVLGVCVQHKKAYCSFPSKLGRIIQQQGRQGQLGISFGSGKHPNCEGLTPDQLQHIDFSKIDFSEFYNDIQNKMTKINPAALQQKLQDEINDMYQNGQKQNGHQQD